MDERYFRHIKVFNGCSTTFRAFSNDVMVAIGRLDATLARTVKELLKPENPSSKVAESKWCAKINGGVSQGLWDSYHFDLYGLLSALTEGAAKQVLTGMLDERIKQKSVVFGRCGY